VWEEIMNSFAYFYLSIKSFYPLLWKQIFREKKIKEKFIFLLYIFIITLISHDSMKYISYLADHGKPLWFFPIVQWFLLSISPMHVLWFYVDRFDKFGGCFSNQDLSLAFVNKFILIFLFSFLYHLLLYI